MPGVTSPERPPADSTHWGIPRHIDQALLQTAELCGWRRFEGSAQPARQGGLVIALLPAELGRWVPLRWLLPALCAIAVAAFTGLYAVHTQRALLNELEREAEGRLRLELDELHASLEGVAARGDWGELQRRLTSGVVDRSLQHLVVVDDRRVVRAELRTRGAGTRWRRWREEIEAATAVDVEALAREAAGRRSMLVVLSSDRSHLVGIAPLRLDVAAPLPGAERVGLLCAWVDLRQPHAAVSARVRASSVQAAMALAGGALLVVTIMELAVFRRLAQLASAAERIAAGDRGAALPGGGGVREISHLASALQRMLGDVLASEHRAREKEILLRTAIDATPAAISVVDPSGALLLGNRSLAEAIGRPLDSLLGRRAADVLPRSAAEFLADRHRRALASGEALAGNGLRIGDRHFLIHTMPVDVGGRRCLLDVAIDLTERVKLEEELRQSQRLETVGRLASGIAHDFNNLLTIVLSNAADLVHSLPAGEARTSAREIEQAGERAALLTQRLLSFSRVSRDEGGVVDVGERVKGFSPLLRSLVGEGVRIQTHVAPGPWPVAIAPVRLEQVLLNLATNARDAMPKGGQLTIRVGPGDDGGGPRRVKIEVSDTGAGMSADVRNRALEPFFTTKPVGRGTGLGLSTCREIVEKAGGRLTLESQPGQGTRVRIQLPLATDEAAASPRPAEASAARGGSETILVCEDDADVLHLIERTLRAHGYRVLPARSADQALQLARASRHEIALLIADLVLPGKSGLDLSAELKRDRPTLRLLLASGYGEETRASLGAEPDAPLLSKPFTPDALLRAVREVLDRPRG